MTNPIALVTRLDAARENQWLSLISAHLPGEQILSFRAMSAADRQRAEIAIVANPDPADVAELSSLIWIHSLWAGVERLVDELGTKAPPIVRLVDPELSRVMAEAVLAWTYYLHRDMPAYRASQFRKQWQPLDYRHPSSLTVGILGMGELGVAAARSLQQAGFNVMGWSRSAKSLDGIIHHHGEDGLTAVLSSADILVCLLPLTAQTRGLLNASRLAQIKTGASLINFARGPIITTDALLATLDSGHLNHAVLDVFDVEPLPQESPLWDHPRITILPHISAPTDQNSAARIVAANIKAFRQTGHIPRTVDMTRGY